MEQLLREAISSIKSGNKTIGRQLLIRVLEEDDKNESAWLWLTQCVATLEQKRECFERVLEINPNNQHAKDGLMRLSTLTGIKTAQSTPTTSSRPEQSQKKSSSGTRIILLLLSIILVCLCGVVVIGLSDSDNESTGASPSRASIICEDIIESRLVAPSTAKFASYYEQQIWTLGKNSGTYENAYRVRGYVDAQNSFGALIRTYYTCDISYNGGEWTDLRNWTLLNLDMDN